MITLYNGSATDFADEDPPVIEVSTDFDTDGCTASIDFMDIHKTFSQDDVASGSLSLVFSFDESKQFLLGQSYMVVAMQDAEGKQRVLAKIPVKVDIAGDKGNDDESNTTESEFDDIEEPAASVKSVQSVVIKILSRLKKK